MTMIKGTPVDFLELGKVPKSWQPALPPDKPPVETEPAKFTTPIFHGMMVDCDLCVSSFCNAFELTHEQLGFMPDTLVVSPGDFADWVLNLSEKFRSEGYNFKVMVNPNLKPDSWFVCSDNRIGYGSNGA